MQISISPTGSAQTRTVAIVAALFILAFAFVERARAQGDAGLSSVRSQQFVNQSFGAFPAEPFDGFAEILAVGDFNGDLADDLVAGTPRDNGIPGTHPSEVGAVTLRYGARSGPGVRGGLHGGLPDVVLVESSTLDFPEPQDHFGRAFAACDFNHDGFEDLAIGVPDEDAGNQANTGAVEIHYGSATGLNSAATSFFHQESAGFPVLPTEPQGFGWALACGDFNGDRFGDLAIGSPNASPVPALTAAGIVLIVNGSVAGLTPSGSYVLHEDTPDMPGISEDLDLFGFALVAGNFDRDSFADLAIGSPGETISGQLQAGAFHMLRGSASGLLPQQSVFFGETSLGGASETADSFSYALAVGDFDGDSFDDLAIGVPTEANGALEATGQVVVLYGRNGNPAFDLSRTLFVDQDSLWGPGAGEPGDFFGQTLAAGDFDGDGHGDLAIGHPGEIVLNPEDGQMTVVMGSGSGLLLTRIRAFAGGLEGLPGDSQEGDRNFAYHLAAGDFDGDGFGDLAIAAPHDDVGTLTDAGSCTVLYGSFFADGFGSGTTELWPEN
jgi:hypothetical protein